MRIEFFYQHAVGDSHQDGAGKDAQIEPMGIVLMIRHPGQEKFVHLFPFFFCRLVLVP